MGKNIVNNNSIVNNKSEERWQIDKKPILIVFGDNKEGKPILSQRRTLNKKELKMQ